MARIKLPPEKEIAPGDFGDAVESFRRFRLYQGKATYADVRANRVTPTSITNDRLLDTSRRFDDAADAWGDRLYRWLERGTAKTESQSQ